MTQSQIIDTLRDYIADLIQDEEQRAARFNALNPEWTHRRDADKAIYIAALTQVTSKLTDISRRIKEDTRA